MVGGDAHSAPAMESQLPTVPDLRRFYNRIRQHQDFSIQSQSSNHELDNDDDVVLSVQSNASLSTVVSKKPTSSNSRVSAKRKLSKAGNLATVQNAAARQLRLPKTQREKSNKSGKAQPLSAETASIDDPGVSDDEIDAGEAEPTKLENSEITADVVDEASMRSAYAEMIRLDLLLQHSEERALLTRQERRQHKRVFQRHLDTILHTASRKHTKEEADNLKKFLEATERDEEEGDGDGSQSSLNENQQLDADDERHAIVPVADQSRSNADTVNDHSDVPTGDDDIVLHSTKSANALQQTLSGQCLNNENKLDFVQRNRLLNGKREKALLTGHEERRLEEILQLTDDEKTDPVKNDTMALAVTQPETTKPKQPSLFGALTDLQHYVSLLDKKLAEYAQVRKNPSEAGNESNPSLTGVSSKEQLNGNSSFLPYDETFVRRRMKEIDERLTALRNQPVPTLDEILSGNSNDMVEDELTEEVIISNQALELPDIVHDAEARSTQQLPPANAVAQRTEAAAKSLQLSLKRSSTSLLTPDALEQLVKNARDEQQLMQSQQQTEPRVDQQLALRSSLSNGEIQTLLSNPRTSSVKLPLEEFNNGMPVDTSTEVQQSIEWPSWLTPSNVSQHCTASKHEPLTLDSGRDLTAVESSQNAFETEEEFDTATDTLGTEQELEVDENELENITSQIDRLITQCSFEDRSTQQIPQRKGSEETTMNSRWLRRMAAKRQKRSLFLDENGEENSDVLSGSDVALNDGNLFL